MQNETNQFNVLTGAERLRSPGYLLILLLIAAGSVFFITRIGITAGIGLVLIPFLLLYLHSIPLNLFSFSNFYPKISSC